MKYGFMPRAFVLAASLTAISVPALAHVSVVASTPAAGSTTKAPRTVALSFSDAMVPSSTSVSIVMTAMPGMENHGEMSIRNFTQSWSEANRKLTLNLRKPLVAGTYDVRWQSKGTDGHKMSGKISFNVK
jgi:methionine-rich copper-binding protein CopC